MSAPPPWLLGDLLLVVGRVEQTMASMAADMDAPVRDARGDPWLNGLVDQIVAGMRDGTVAWCEHLARPTAIFAAAWRLDRLVCPDCWMGELDVSDDLAEDHTCDRCRTLTPGGLHPTVVQAGPVMVAAGLCPGCHQASQALLTGDRR